MTDGYCIRAVTHQAKGKLITEHSVYLLTSSVKVAIDQSSKKTKETLDNQHADTILRNKLFAKQTQLAL